MKKLVPLLCLANFCEESRDPCPEGQVYDWDVLGCRPYVETEPVTADVWRPAQGTTWQWQLSGTLDPSLDVEMYDVDLADTSDAELAALEGKVLVCYFSAGSYEEFRNDTGDIPDIAIGQRLEGWRDERWMDVTHPAVRDLVRTRLDLAVARGCDAVEPDNVDGYANVNGFDLTAAEQLDFNRFVADEAHRRGLSVGLKNDLDQLGELEPWFDWALNEECFNYEECGSYAPWMVTEKAVFHVEYVRDWSAAEGLANNVCANMLPGFSSMIKTFDLGPEFLPCPTD